MTWFRVDDQFTRHEKYHLAGKDGRALWYAVGVECAAASTDGRVPGHMLRAWAASAEASPRAAAKLVRAGLWHDSTNWRDCPRCVAAMEDHNVTLVEGDHLFHDWDVYQLDKAGKDDPVHRFREMRRKRLHNQPELKLAVRLRDRDLCRYCGVLTVWGNDHRSDIAGQHDHIDPFGDNTLENLVVSCRKCNVAKGCRTPEQAHMALLAATVYGPVPGLDTQPKTQPMGSGTQPMDPVGPSRDARDGPGRVGNGSGMVSNGNGSH